MHYINHGYESYTIDIPPPEKEVSWISLYGAPLAQSAYLALHSSLFGTDGAINYDYIITDNINSLLIGSRYIFPMMYTLTIVEPLWPIL